MEPSILSDLQATPGRSAPPRRGTDRAPERAERSFGAEIEQVVARRERRGSTFASHAGPALERTAGEFEPSPPPARPVAPPVDGPDGSPPEETSPLAPSTAPVTSAASTATPEAPSSPVPDPALSVGPAPTVRPAAPSGAAALAGGTTAVASSGANSPATAPNASGPTATTVSPVGTTRAAPRPAATTETLEARMEALARQLRVQLHARGQDVRLRLDPPELGELTVRFSLRSGRMHAFLHVEDGRAATWLLEGSDALRRSLAEAGIRLEWLQVRHEGSSDAAASDGRSAQHPASEPGGRSRVRVLERRFSAAEPPPGAIFLPHDGQLSLWA